MADENKFMVIHMVLLGINIGINVGTLYDVTLLVSVRKPQVGCLFSMFCIIYQVANVLLQMTSVIVTREWIVNNTRQQCRELW